MGQQRFYKVWHMRADEEGQDHDKLLGIYSSREKAEQALAGLRVKPGFRDYPDGFELYEAALDETCFTEGFVSLWGDEEPDDEGVATPPVYLILQGYNEDGGSIPQKYYTLWIRFLVHPAIGLAISGPNLGPVRTPLLLLPVFHAGNHRISMA